MKSVFGATFFASALALVAGCSSGVQEPSGDDTATNAEALRRGPGGGRPGSDPCALVRCAAGTSCVADRGRASCEPNEPTNPCAAVLCLVGTTCEVVDGDAVCTPNEPAPSGPFCGGFAGIECPGAGSCVDDPSDDCDPERGGADCGGVCECGNVLLLCIEGTVFDQSPDVCACVPDPALDPCAAVRCAAGTSCVVVDGAATCEPDEPTNPCALVLCAPDSTCEVVNGDAVCTPVEPSAPFCGGFAGFPCPGAGSCVDDRSDDCDPERGGADCGGVCECNVLALCIEGFVFDGSPEVCECVPRPEENPCALVDCFPNSICEVIDGQAVCTPIEPPNPCAAVLCAPGRVCVAEGAEARCERRGRRPGRR